MKQVVEDDRIAKVPKDKGNELNHKDCKNYAVQHYNKRRDGAICKLSGKHVCRKGSCGVNWTQK